MTMSTDATRPITPTTSGRGHNTNKGRRFPPDPPTIEEIVQALAHCTPQGPGLAHRQSASRLRALIVLIWRTGLRISEALDLEERDLMPQDMAIVVRRGKGDKRRVVAMDEFGWRELRAWLALRQELPAGPIFCVLRGRTAGAGIADADVRRQFNELRHRAGVHRRFNPHSLRHACAVELWREGISLLVIQAQLGHARLDVTQIYLKGLAPVELLEPIGRRRPPMMLIPSVGSNR